MELYEKDYGTWREYRVGFGGEGRWVNTTYVPRDVLEAARGVSSCRVEYEHRTATVLLPPPASTEDLLRAALAAHEKAHAQAQVAAHRPTSSREAALAGGLLGELIADLTRPRR